MTDKQHAYDPDLPYVVVDADGDVMAKLHGYPMALIVAERYIFGRVIDTTPKPRVPEDATFITWWSKDTRWYAEMCSGTWRVGRDSLFEAVEDLPGVTPETVFTVLEERKS